MHLNWNKFRKTRVINHSGFFAAFLQSFYLSESLKKGTITSINTHDNDYQLRKELIWYESNNCGSDASEVES